MKVVINIFKYAFIMSESCFGDITSSDCPTSTTGKTGVIAKIAENTASLASKCEDSKCTATSTSLTKVGEFVFLVLLKLVIVDSHI